MSYSLRRLRKIIDELADEDSFGGITGTAVDIDALISALEEAFPEVVRATDYNFEFSKVIKQLVKAKKLKPRSQELAEKIQDLLDRGDYPNRLHPRDSVMLQESLKEMADCLKELF